MRVSVIYVAIDPDDPDDLEQKIQGAVKTVEMSRRVISASAVPIEPSVRGLWQRWAVLLSTTDGPEDAGGVRDAPPGA
jgi:hypothetical protein